MRREAANKGGGPGTGQKGNGRVSISGAEAGRLVSELAIEAEEVNKNGSLLTQERGGTRAFCGSGLSCVYGRKELVPLCSCVAGPWGTGGEAGTERQMTAT